MNLAPKSVLSAALQTLSMGMAMCRNLALDDAASKQQIAELMEALHEIPNLLASWDPHDVNEVRNHLGYYNAEKWGGLDLVQVFDQRFAQYDSAPRYILWRQDDNGNRVMVAEYLDEKEAERACAEYEARGHKQTYWVTQKG